MFIQKKDLIVVINRYILENLQQQNISEIASLLSSIDNKKNFIDSKDMLLSMLCKEGFIENEGVDVFSLIIEHYFNSNSGSITGNEKAKNNIHAQKIFIFFLCNIYNVEESRKKEIIDFWSSLGQHILNPATPFAILTTMMGQLGFAAFLFFVMEISWFTDKDVYYKLVELDRALMNILTLTSSERFINNFNKLVKENAIELLLNTLTLYIKPSFYKNLDTSIESIDLIIDGQKYDLTGEQNSKNLSKERIKTLIFDLLYDSAKNSIKDALSDMLSQDPEALNKKEKLSIEKSGGKTAYKFNVIDNL